MASTSAYNVTTQAPQDDWTCDGTLNSVQLLEKIMSSGPAIKASVFVPVALLVVTWVVALDTMVFSWRVKKSWKIGVFTLWVISAFPVLSTFALLGLFVPKALISIKFGISFYFALSLKKFFQLVLTYYGGKQRMEALLTGVIYPPNPFPCCCVACCCRNEGMSLRRLHILQGLVYQIVIIYPTTYFLQTLLLAERLPPQQLGSVIFAFEFVIGFSVVVCMYGYVILGKSSFIPLQQFGARRKYVCLQLLVLFITLQDVLLDGLGALNVIPCGFPYPTRNRGLAIHMFLLVCEFFVVIFLVRLAFRRSDAGCVVVHPHTSPSRTDLISAESFTDVKKAQEARDNS